MFLCFSFCGFFYMYDEVDYMTVDLNKIKSITNWLEECTIRYGDVQHEIIIAQFYSWLFQETKQQLYPKCLHFFIFYNQKAKIFFFLFIWFWAFFLLFLLGIGLGLVFLLLDLGFMHVFVTWFSDTCCLQSHTLVILETEAELICLPLSYILTYRAIAFKICKSVNGIGVL